MVSNIQLDFFEAFPKNLRLYINSVTNLKAVLVFLCTSILNPQSSVLVFYCTTVLDCRTIPWQGLLQKYDALLSVDIMYLSSDTQ